MHFECGLYLSRKDRSNPQHLTTVLTPGKSWEEQLYRSWDERSCFLSVWQLSFVRTALNNNRNSPLARAHQGSPWVYRKVHYNTNSRNESMGTQCFIFLFHYFLFFTFCWRITYTKKHTKWVFCSVFKNWTCITSTQNKKRYQHPIPFRPPSNLLTTIWQSLTWLLIP